MLEYLLEIRKEWRQKVEDKYIPTDERIDLESDLLDRIFKRSSLLSSLEDSAIRELIRRGEVAVYQDSTGREIKIGDTVRHRGAQYIIKEFGRPESGKPIKILFENTKTTGDEWSVDLIKYRGL